MLNKYNQKISVNYKSKSRLFCTCEKRISGRVSCSICKKPFNEFFDPPVEPNNCSNNKCDSRELIKRSDDNESTVTNRLKTYDDQTLPILDYYRKKDREGCGCYESN